MIHSYLITDEGIEHKSDGAVEIAIDVKNSVSKAQGVAGIAEAFSEGRTVQMIPLHGGAGFRAVSIHEIRRGVFVVSCSPLQVETQRPRLTDAISDAAMESGICGLPIGPSMARSFINLLSEAGYTFAARPLQMQSAIPSGIHFNPEHDNFYNTTTLHGCGNEFYQKWHPRRKEFPQRNGLKSAGVGA